MTINKFFKIFRTFKYAAKGIIYTIKNERNMRIHSVVAVYVILLAILCKMNAYEYSILILTIALVMMGEMVNTALENLIDLCSKEYNSTAKVAKDIAAGAVLIISMAAAMIGLLLFLKKQAYTKLWVFFCFNPLAILFFLFSIFLSYFYVFLGPTEVKNKVKSFFSRIKNKFSNFNKIKNMDGDSNEK